MFLEMELFSESIGRMTHVNVIIPDPQKNEDGTVGINTRLNPGTNGLKTLYLLHGLSDDCTVWHRKTAIERYASEKGIAVIMPDGGRSWYTDEKYGYKYYQYVAKELTAIMEYTFPLSTDPKDRYIAGLSMGGYGALKIGLREQGRYSKIIALSGVIDMEHRLQIERERVKNGQVNCEALKWAFGEELTVPDPDNTVYLAKNYSADFRPDLFIAIGTDDWHLPINRSFMEKIKNLDFNVTYIEDEGDHLWQYWDEHIEKAIDWMLK